MLDHRAVSSFPPWERGLPACKWRNEVSWLRRGGTGNSLPVCEAQEGYIQILRLGGCCGRIPVVQAAYYQGVKHERNTSCASHPGNKLPGADKDIFFSHGKLLYRSSGFHGWKSTPLYKLSIFKYLALFHFIPFYSTGFSIEKCTQMSYFDKVWRNAI